MNKCEAWHKKLQRISQFSNKLSLARHEVKTFLSYLPYYLIIIITSSQGICVIIVAGYHRKVITHDHHRVEKFEHTQ